MAERSRPANGPAQTALEAWYRRGDWQARDALWLAAAEERTALELEGLGLRAAAERARQHARDVVAAAARCREPGCSHAGAACLRAHESRGGRSIAATAPTLSHP